MTCWLVVSDILSHFRTKPYGTPIPRALEDDVLHFGMAINMSSMLRIVEFSMRCHSYLRSFALIDSPNLQPAVRAMMGPAPIKKTLCLHLHGYIVMYLYIYVCIFCVNMCIYIYTLPIWICKYLRYPSMQWIVSAVLSGSSPRYPPLCFTPPSGAKIGKERVGVFNLS